MAKTEKVEVSPDVVREVKAWLRNSVLAPGVSTPLQFLYMAFRLQGGRRSAAEFASVILQRCPGLRVDRRRDKPVVEGVAPRWDVGSLTRVIILNGSKT